MSREKDATSFYCDLCEKQITDMNHEHAISDYEKRAKQEAYREVSTEVIAIAKALELGEDVEEFVRYFESIQDKEKE